MDGNRFRRNSRLLAAAFLCALIFTAPGCGKPETISSGKHPSSLELDLGLAIPSAKELRIPTNRSDFYKLDYRMLGGCDLQITLGKYQSSLGKKASDSQRLLLDLEYLRLAPQCIKLKRKTGETKLAAILAETEKLKRTKLLASIYNATLASTEFQQFWGKLAAYNAPPRQRWQALAALRAINALAGRWNSGDYRASNIVFEIYLSEVAQGGILYDVTPSRETRHIITQLEQQLAAALPKRYKVWRDHRPLYFARLEQPIKLD